MDHKVSTLRRNRVSALGLTVVVLLFAVTAFTQQGGRDELRIVLGSNGFSPTKLQHSPGTFALAVENTTLTDEYTLKLKAEDGTVLYEFAVQKGSSAWTVNLPGGRYTLTEINHPQWVCNIVVQ